MTIPQTPRAEPEKPIFSQDEVDLRQVVRAVWRYRFVIVALGLLGALAGLATGWLSTRYVSQGLFLTPGLSVSSFKRYEASLSNRPRMLEFIRLTAREEHFATPLLLKLIDIPGAMSAAIRPVFGFTTSDAKTFDVKLDDQTMVGVQMTLTDEEQHSSSPLFSLADYFRSTVIRADLQDVMIDSCLRFEKSARELRNEQIQADFEISQQRTRADNLRKVMVDYPEASNAQDRQVVLLETGGERYLSPASQLIAVEVAIADMELERQRRERTRIAAALKKDYYCRAHEAMQAEITGTQFLASLDALQEDVFRGQDPKAEVIEQAANELTNERRGWFNAYVEQMRFVVSPEGHSTRVRSPSLRVGLLAGGVLGGLFGLLLALMLAWWHDNRESVMAKS